MAGSIDIRGIAELTDRVTPVLRQISAGMRRVAGEQMFNRLGAQAKSVSAAYRGVGSAFEAVGQKVKGIVSGLAAVGVTFAAAQGVVMGFAAYTLKAFADAGGGLADLSAKTGLSAEKLQELGYAAKMVGVDSAAMGTGLTKLNKVLAEAQGGKNKKAVALFKQMGVEFKGKSLAQIIPNIAEAFKKNTNEAQRTAMAMALFGKAGADLIPMLIGGRNALAEMAQKARDMGIIISNEDVELADALGDSLDTLGMAIRGVGVKIGANLAPAVIPMINGMLEWIKVNKEWLAWNIAGAILDVVRAIREIDFRKIYENMMSFIEGTDRLVQTIGGWKSVFIGLASIIGLNLVISAGSFVLAIGKLINEMLKWGVPAAIVLFKGLHAAITAVVTVMGGLVSAGLMLPLILGGALIAGAIYNWGEFSAALGKVKEGFDQLVSGDIIGGVTTMLKGVVTAGGAAVKGVVQMIGDAIGVDLVQKIAEATEAIKKALDDYLLKPFRDAVAAVKALLGGIALPDIFGSGGAPRGAPGNNSNTVPGDAPSTYGPGRGNPGFQPPPQRTGSLLEGRNYEPGSLLRSATQAGVITPPAQRGEGVVTVRFANAPPGTQASTSSSGDLFRMRQGDMGYAMQGTG